jgi:hypothetical protein
VSVDQREIRIARKRLVCRLVASTTRNPRLTPNSEFDPWRSASVSSEIRPGGPMVSTPKAPVFLTKGAIHCTELNARAGQVNEDVRKTQVESIAIMKKWVNEYYATTGRVRRRKNRGWERRSVRPGRP